MRFLHTSDWHLGKIFHGMPLTEEQEHFLKQIHSELNSAEKSGSPYSALLVPGDIYDRAVPTAEAAGLFSSFLNRTSEDFPELHIFIISGNHDSPGRLSYFSRILEAHNIHICTAANNIEEPVVIKSWSGEKACVYQIPFLYPLSISNGKNLLRTQQELYEAACTRIRNIHEEKYGELPCIVCAHLFTASSRISSSERSFVGTAEQVSADIFENFTYTALGHIHKFQPCGGKKNIFYSGAPLAYDFGDSSETFMLDVTVNVTGTPEIRKVPFSPLHRTANLEGKFSDFYGENADRQLIEKHRNDYIQIVCTDSVITQGAMNLIQTNFPLCLSFVQKSGNTAGTKHSFEERKNAITSREPEKIFDSFIQDAYGITGYTDSIEKDEKELLDEERKLFAESTKNSSWQ